MVNPMLADLVKLLLAIVFAALSVWTMLEWNVWFVVWITLAFAFTVWLFFGSAHRTGRRKKAS